jgi:hypothetical protein
MGYILANFGSSIALSIMLSKHKNENTSSVLNCSGHLSQTIFEALTKAGITTVWNY